MSKADEPKEGIKIQDLTLLGQLAFLHSIFVSTETFTTTITDLIAAFQITLAQTTSA